ncbi:hypothetical protein GND98_019395 [Clostridium butyricum]|uniref:Uncharacterized protein n=1 Tax=Clostridium butyricum TaxID=1492 RepID=A0A6L9EW59_CLOBU|nr:hypothetical protein [Clostridium butyricum]MDU4800672.1 hypothetical protein [Clostridium butyricum]NAS19925.1 hypothetical protein [Clostridium butyricum]
MYNKIMVFLNYYFMEGKFYEVIEKNNIRIYEKLDKISDINKMLVSNNIEVFEICINRDNLEDYFLNLISRDKSRGFNISKEEV